MPFPPHVYRIVSSGGWIRPAIAGDGFRFPGSTSGQVDLAAPATVTSYALTLPDAQGGVDTYLKNNGSGVLSWSSVASSTQWESTAGLFQAKTAEVTAGDSFNLQAKETDGASAVAHILDNSVTLSTAGALLLSIRNNTTEKFSVAYDGKLYWPALATSTVYHLSTGSAAGRARLYMGQSNADGIKWGFNVYVSSAWRGPVFGYTDAVNPRMIFVGALNSTQLDFGIGSGGKIYLDVTPPTDEIVHASDLVAGDTYISKSAASGGNLSIVYDNAEIFRDNGTDIFVLASRGLGLRTAMSDANPVTKMMSGGIRFGAGGASAVDVGIERDAAGIVKVSNGGSGYGTFKTLITKWITLTDAATIATDASLGNKFKVTLGNNRTLGNPTNATDGQTLVYWIQQSTGGHTLAFDTKFIFGSDITSITLSTGASKVDIMTVVYDSSLDKFLIVSIVKGYN